MTATRLLTTVFVALLIAVPAAFAISAPTLTGISTTANGTTSLTLAGTGFQNGLTVTLTQVGGAPVTLSGGQIQNVTATSFQVTVPALASAPGLYLSYVIQVTNPDGGTYAAIFPTFPGVGVVTIFTASSAEVDLFNTTAVTQRVDTFSVELRARMQGGAVLFDQTYPVAFGDPAVQAGILQAKAVLTGAGAVAFLGPTQLSNSQTLANTTTTTVPTGPPVSQINIVSTSFIGPTAYLVGNLICPNAAASLSYAIPGLCTGGAPFLQPAGTLSIDTRTITTVTTPQTATTTNTFLTTQVYELTGLLTAPAGATVPTLSEWGMIGFAILLAGVAAVGLRHDPSA